MADYPDAKDIDFAAMDRQIAARMSESSYGMDWKDLLFFAGMVLSTIFAPLAAVIVMAVVGLVCVSFILHPFTATLIACLAGVGAFRSYKSKKRHVVPFRDDLAVQLAPYIAIAKWVLLFSTLLAALACYSLLVNPSTEAQSIIHSWTPKWPK
jgi:hypothetical protein